LGFNPAIPNYLPGGSNTFMGKILAALRGGGGGGGWRRNIRENISSGE